MGDCFATLATTWYVLYFMTTLGTLHDGEPNLAMVAYSFAEDFSTFYIHVSRLGKHTTDMENDPRVSLLIQHYKPYL